MVSKNANKLKFSVESLLEPTVTATNKCQEEAINPFLSPSIAGPGRQFGKIVKPKLNDPSQGG